MANTNQPYGFLPIGTLGASEWSGKTNLYYIPSTDGSAYAPGDAVKAGSGGDAAGVPVVVKSNGTDAVRGVITNVLLAIPNNTSLQGKVLDDSTLLIPATKTRAYYVLVSDDPNTIYSVQGDASSANQVATACNLNASFTVTNPTTPSMVSASVLGGATINTTNSLNLKIMGLDGSPANAYGAYARWKVKFNLIDTAAGYATGATGV
jgi:hypothetical protein